MFNKSQEKIINDLTLSSATSFKKISAKNFSKEFLFKCIDLNANIVLSNFPYKLRDKEVCLTAIKNNDIAMDYIPFDLRTDDFYLEAYTVNKNVFTSLPKRLRDICVINAFISF